MLCALRVILLLSAAAEGGGVSSSFASVDYADNAPLRSSSVPGGPTEIARVSVDLVEAAKGNDLPSVKRLLAGGLVHPDDYLRWRWKQPDGFLDHYSDGALMEASRRGHTDTVRLLMDWRCNTDLKSPRGGHTALMLASLHGHKSVVRLLVACGASADVKTVFGASALGYAQMNNHTDVENILLAMGATSEPASSQHLFQAAEAGDAQRVQKLLADGAQPDGYLDCAGNSALMVTVLALLEGRKQNLMSDDQDQDQYFDVIHMLLNAGASPDHLGSGRKTQGVRCGHAIPFAQPDASSRTALMEASEAGDETLVGLLLSSGADPDKQNKCSCPNTLLTGATGQRVLPTQSHVACCRGIRGMHGETALICASEQWRPDVVQMLLSNGADPDMQKIDGVSALLDSATRGNSDVVRMLLESKANPDLQEHSWGHSALMIASARGDTQMVRMLLSHCANTELRSHSGARALEIAESDGSSCRASLSTPASKEAKREVAMLLRRASHVSRIARGRVKVQEEEEEGGKALNEVDAGRDRAGGGREGHQKGIECRFVQ